MNNPRPTDPTDPTAKRNPNPDQVDPYTLDKPRCTATYQTERCTLPTNHPQPMHIGPPPHWALWTDPH